MRYGALISAVCHAGLVSFVMLSTPRQFVASERSIEAELVRADEIDRPKEQPQEQPKEQPKPEKPSVWDFPEEKLRIELPKFSPDARPNSSEALRSKSAASKGAQPAPAAAGQQQAQSPGQQQPSAPAQSAPSNSQQAALAQPQPSIAQQAPSAPAAQPKAAPSVFDPANIPMLMDLPNAAGLPEKGFDFEATVTANISGDERAAFKAHLRKCWKLPDGVSPAARAVVRVYLKRDGTLASEPVVIEVSGVTRGGAEVLLAAKSALAACQPYAFPAEKYREWRILDLTFTPKDMAGG